MAVIATLKLKGMEGLPPAKTLKPMLYAALVDMAERWRSKYLREHFKNSATTRYNYTPRQGERNSTRNFRGSYTWRKKRDQGHTKPLVWSGGGMNEAMNTSEIEALGSMNSLRVRIKLPRKFNLRHPKSKIRMSDEITRVIPSEERDLGKYLVKRIEYRLTNFNKRSRLRAA